MQDQHAAFPPLEAVNGGGLDAWLAQKESHLSTILLELAFRKDMRA